MASPLGLPDPREWLGATIRTTQALDREVLAILRAARIDTNRMLREVEARSGIGAAVRREQLLIVRQNLLRQQAEIWRRLGKVIEARRLEAAANVIKLGGKIDAVLLGTVGGLEGGADIARSLMEAEMDTAKRSMDRLIARANGSSNVPLSERVYQSEVSIGSVLDRRISSALVRGLSAREFSQEVSDFINPNTPGGLRYASMRLARTEINNSAHAVAINAAQDKPWVLGMKWRISSSHPKPDICDQLAKGGTKGDGVYPKTEVPKKPHPHCFCWVTPETPSDEDFLDNLVAGQYDGFLEKFRNKRPGETIVMKLG